ncbi:EAL domain-containing protein [Marinomonas mediterranea]|uniref:EAL domain-containing protein n=1 Tax=Marinomonas mediterranea TaxID=119864 RepID=UPI00234BE35A|nr:EAL domain-containing protein [Marinomonas mediterranea]WCN10108.1 EAL domain-containing protein [Marinomonas mediterranea]
MTINAHTFISLLNLNNRVYFSSYAALFIFSSLIFFPVLLHLIIILYHSSYLKDYGLENLTTATQVQFQIKQSLTIQADDENTLCSKEDFKRLREFIDKYHYIGDVGRIQDGKMLCSVKQGILERPLELPSPDIISKEGTLFWNNQNKKDINDNTSPFFGRGNTVAFISSLYMKDFELYSHTSTSHFGGILYSSNENFVYKVFGDISLNTINHAKDLPDSILNYLPIPNRFIKRTFCDGITDTCILVINRKLGLYRLGYPALISLAILNLLIGALIVVLYGHYRSGPKLFIRQLKQAIKKDKITPEYQPKLQLFDKKIIGVEALARWHDPRLGQVPPDLFITSAEELGLINELSRKFILKVLDELHGQLENDSSFSVSINLSSEILTEPNFHLFLRDALERYNINVNQIILEITERTSSNNKSMSESSKHLSEEGYLISLDDFGTGFSNLEWLSTLEPYELKVDKMFTQSIEANTIQNYSLLGILKMIEYLDVVVVFEGIETEEQYQLFREKAPTAIGQGWYFYRSMPIEKLLAILEKSHSEKMKAA